MPSFAKLPSRQLRTAFARTKEKPMSAYLDIQDPEAIANYRSKALPLVAEAGGRLIALDDAPLELEGWPATNC